MTLPGADTARPVTDLRIPLLPPWVRWLGVAAVAGVIFSHSLLTAPPAVPKPEPFSLDKWQHFLAYGTQSASLGYSLVDTRRRLAVVVVAGVGATIAYGLGIELAQGLLARRYFSWGDALANAVGAVLAAPLYVLLRRVPREPVLPGWAPTRPR